MMLTAIYCILLKGEAYNPGLYRQSDISPVDREEQAIALLQKKGYSIQKVAA